MCNWVDERWKKREEAAAFSTSIQSKSRPEQRCIVTCFERLNRFMCPIASYLQLNDSTFRSPMKPSRWSLMWTMLGETGAPVKRRSPVLRVKNWLM